MLEQNELLTEQQTADMLGLVPITLSNWRSQRRGPPAVKIGRKCFYRRETVMNWIASREGAVAAEPVGSTERKRTARAARGKVGRK